LDILLPKLLYFTQAREYIWKIAIRFTPYIWYQYNITLNE